MPHPIPRPSYTAKYILHHLPTGRRWKKESEFASEQDFLRHLNDWNRRGDGKWLHSSVAYHAPALPVQREISSERMCDQHVVECNRLAETGIWSKDGDQPELEEMIGDEPQMGC